MKKLFVMMVLVMAALAVNAQRTAVKVTDLQKAITDNIAKDYAGFTVMNATKIQTKDVTEFEVVIMKGTDHQTLLYDKDGKFLKKVVKQEGSTAMHKTKSTSKPPVKK